MNKYLKLFAILFLCLLPLVIYADVNDNLIKHCKLDDIDGVLNALQNGADINTKENESQKNALMIAANKGSVDIVQLLIKEKIDINAKTNLDETALMYAIEAKNIDIVRILINNGADMEIETKLSYTPLMKAAIKGYTNIAESFIEKGADINAGEKRTGQNALLKAAYYNQFDMVRLLHDYGADISYKDKNGLTALLIASREGNFEIVRYLTENGADISAKCILGYTPLLYALEFGSPDIAMYLIDKGADFNAANNSEKNAFMIAASNGHTDIVKLLMEKGVDVDAKTSGGLTALSLAKKRNHKEIIELLDKKDPEVTGDEQSSDSSDVADTDLDRKEGDVNEDSIEKQDEIVEKVENVSTPKQEEIVEKVENFSTSEKDKKVVKKEDIKTDPDQEKVTEEAKTQNIPPKPVGGLRAIQKVLKIPEEAEEDGLEGRVVVNVLIDKSGNIIEAKILKSLGKEKGCDEAAIAAIMKVKWEPALKNGEPVEEWVEVPVHFRIR